MYLYLFIIHHQYKHNHHIHYDLVLIHIIISSTFSFNIYIYYMCVCKYYYRFQLIECQVAAERSVAGSDSEHQRVTAPNHWNLGNARNRSRRSELATWTALGLGRWFVFLDG